MLTTNKHVRLRWLQMVVFPADTVDVTSLSGYLKYYCSHICSYFEIHTCTTNDMLIHHFSVKTVKRHWKTMILIPKPFSSLINYAVKQEFLITSGGIAFSLASWNKKPLGGTCDKPNDILVCFLLLMSFIKTVDLCFNDVQKIFSLIMLYGAITSFHLIPDHRFPLR